MASGDVEKELRQVAESLVLADRMFRKGRIAEAEPMYERSLAMLLRTYAEAHPDIDACLLRLGDIYFARAKFAQSLSTYSRLHGLRSRMLSIHHADTIAISFKVAKSQEQLEHFDEAARTYEEAISLGEQWLPAGSPLIGSMMEGYAILLRKYMNQPRAASEVEQRAKEYRKKYTGRKGGQQAWQIKTAPAPSSIPAPTPTPGPVPAPIPTPDPTPAPAPAPPVQQYKTQLDRRFTLKPDDASATASDTGFTPVAKLSPDAEEEAATDDLSPEADGEYDDEEYDDEECEDERPAPKNYLLIAFIVFAAVVVPTFVGWIVMTRHPTVEFAQPASQPTSIGGTTMPVTNVPGGAPALNSSAPGSQPVDEIRSPGFAPSDKRAEPILPNSR